MCCSVSGARGDTGTQSSGTTAMQESHSTRKKRPPTSDAEIYQRKIKRIRERLQLGSPVESNAVMALHEYDKDLKYELVEQIGPVHDPSFTIRLVVNGQVSALQLIATCAAKLEIILQCFVYCYFLLVVKITEGLRKK